MAIRREMKYTMNLGVFGLPSTITTHFVGGSPVTIAGGSFAYGEKGNQDWLVEISGTLQGVNPGSSAPFTYDVIGIAWFGDEGPSEQFLPKDHVTLLGFPLYATLYKGPSEPTAPFDDSLTYNVGDLLRPKVKTVGTGSYAVWTNEPYGSVASNAGVVYFGKVMAVEGTGANTVLTVYFTPMLVTTA